MTTEPELTPQEQETLAWWRFALSAVRELLQELEAEQPNTSRGSPAARYDIPEKKK